MISVTLLLCISTAASCSFDMSHIHTVVAMFSLYDTRKAPSQLHESLPAAQKRHVFQRNALQGTKDLRPGLASSGACDMLLQLTYAELDIWLVKWHLLLCDLDR